MIEVGSKVTHPHFAGVGEVVSIEGVGASVRVGDNIHLVLLSQLQPAAHYLYALYVVYTVDNVDACGQPEAIVSSKEIAELWVAYGKAKNDGSSYLYSELALDELPYSEFDEFVEKQAATEPIVEETVESAE